MPFSRDIRGHYVRLTIRGTEESSCTVSDAANFLSQFNRLYTLIRIATDPRYDRVSLNSPGSRLSRSDQLYIDRLSLGSPLELVAVISLALGVPASAWALFQMYIASKNLPLDLRKKQLDLANSELDFIKKMAELSNTYESLSVELGGEKLTISSQKEITDTTEQPNEVGASLDEIRSRLENRDALDKINETLKSLSKSPIQIDELMIELEPTKTQLNDLDLDQASRNATGEESETIREYTVCSGQVISLSGDEAEVLIYAPNERLVLRKLPIKQLQGANLAFVGAHFVIKVRRYGIGTRWTKIIEP